MAYFIRARFFDQVCKASHLQTGTAAAGRQKKEYFDFSKAHVRCSHKGLINGAMG
jgi:hypothetical protein